MPRPNYVIKFILMAMAILFLVTVATILAMRQQPSSEEAKVHVVEKILVVLPNGLQCLEHSHMKRYGVTCNWQKWNEDNRLCRAKKFKGKFPLVEGDCNG
ncbi:hypothetical protein GD1_225 [Paraglaciecola Antarctic GD virus 1]|nr:hypothetical protein GD1_225 [Paraglaciecola Antarctic GD virus 1]